MDRRQRTVSVACAEGLTLDSNDQPLKNLVVFEHISHKTTWIAKAHYATFDGLQWKEGSVGATR